MQRGQNEEDKVFSTLLKKKKLQVEFWNVTENEGDGWLKSNGFVGPIDFKTCNSWNINLRVSGENDEEDWNDHRKI